MLDEGGAESSSPAKGRQKVKLDIRPSKADGLPRALSKNSRAGMAAYGAKPSVGQVKVEVHAETKEMEVVPKQALEEVINLEVLMQLKTAFARADKDGGGDLSVDEFVKAFLDVLGNESGEEGLRQMFMKIDANADGTIDWDEFSSFMLLQNQGKQSMLESETHAQYKELDDVRLALLEEQYKHAHKDMIDRVLYVPHGDKWATTSRDGSIRFWQGKDLSYIRTLRCGKAWVTDLGHMPRQNKLVAATFSRNLRIYDGTTYEIVGKLTELEHTPLTIDCWVHNKNDGEITDRVVTGDNGGNLHLYLMVERDDEDKLLNNETLRLDRLWKQTLHQDWVTKVRFMPDVNNLLSCSLDKTLVLSDVERRSPIRRLIGHPKAVYSFDWSPQFKFIASCGLDRHIMLWNPFSAKSIGTLVGHAASVQDVLVIERENQIVSIDIDKVVKVWDIRNHKCLQTFTDKQLYRPENRISAVAYDKVRRQLLTAATTLKPWPLQNWDLSRSGQCHSEAVTSALYNANFQQVVSGDRGSNVCVWEVESGRMRFRFGGAQAGKPEKITAMAFDKAGRRLLTGTNKGVVKMWNFSNGSCLKEMLPKGVADEVTAITYVHGGYQNKNVLGVGWNRKVTFWEDSEKKEITAGRQLQGHADDILCVDLQLPSTLVTGSYDGVIIVWNIDSGAMKLRLQAPGCEQRLLTERSVEKVLFLKRFPGVLASCGADGCIRFWDGIFSEGCLCEIQTGHRGGEGVLAMAMDPETKFMVTGDAAGIVMVWNIEGFNGKPCRTPEATHKAIHQRCEFRAHGGTITSVDFVTFPVDGKPLLVTGSADCNVVLWSIDGVRVGNFGRDQWTIDNPATWAASAIEPINDVDDPEVERWTDEAYYDSEEEDLPKPNKLYQDDDETQDAGRGATAMQMLAFKQFVRKERKEPPLDQRVWLPTGNKRLNYPHTMGRPATSISHLLHITDLNIPSERPTTSFRSRREPTDDAANNRRRTIASRPQTVSGVKGKRP